MRRKVIALTALVCLIAAGSAYAATTLNNYSASFKFAGKAGSKKKPAAAGFTLTYKAANTTKGDRAWPLIDIQNTLSGISSNWKYFPKCTARQISPGYKSCPKNSLVATGTVKSALGPSADMATNAAHAFPCALDLNVYNSGRGKLTYWFIVPNPANCGGIQTGAATPYVATLKEVRGNLFQDVPLPPDVSTAAAGIPGFYGSLEYEKLTFKNMTVRVRGKRVPFLQSNGCKRKRAWSVKFTATNGKIKQSKRISGRSAC